MDSKIIEDWIAIEKAEWLKKFCQGQDSCKRCVFSCRTVCSLGAFNPCDWDFKKVEGGKNDSLTM